MPYPSLLHPVPLPLQQTAAGCTSTGDAQTQFCLSLCGVPGSWCTQGMCEPSEHLWWEWGLILNMNSPLLPSCWGFSFAFGLGISLHSHSRAYFLTGVSLTLGMGYLMAAPGCAATIRCSSAMQASLSITNSWSLLKLMSIESAMPSNHLILSCPLFLLPSIPPSILLY